MITWVRFWLFALCDQLILSDAWHLFDRLPIVILLLCLLLKLLIHLLDLFNGAFFVNIDLRSELWVLFKVLQKHLVVFLVILCLPGFQIGMPVLFSGLFVLGLTRVLCLLFLGHVLQLPVSLLCFLSVSGVSLLYDHDLWNRTLGVLQEFIKVG